MFDNRPDETGECECWMAALARHHAATRRRHPDDRLLVVFDIDGTILDMRHAVLHVLRAYDRVHGTSFFATLMPEDIGVHEVHVPAFLAGLGLAPDIHAAIVAWYAETLWRPETIVSAHRPYPGVFDVVRWLRARPGTEIALNTGRPEALRGPTLASLNRLGAPYGVRFDPTLLHMTRDWSGSIVDAKARAIERWRADGWRVVAAIDNEPANLDAMQAADTCGEVLFLHADTLFVTPPRPLPRTVGGRDYDADRLAAVADASGAR